MTHAAPQRVERTLEYRAALLVLAAAALCACGSTEGAHAETRATPEQETRQESTTAEQEPVPLASPAPGHLVEGFYVEADAPSPTACASDGDCVASGTVAADGCCWSYRDMNASAQSRLYQQWLAAHRATACAAATCPSPPVPSPPPECLFAVRCDQGACVNGC